jgi:glycerol-3-phosphate dehydrogenase (NAD(P)+)
MSKVAVIGSGAWGTALALLALRAGNEAALVARDAATAATISQRRENARLPGVVLPEQLELHHEIPDAAELLVWAVPTQHLRGSLHRLGTPTKAMVVCAKGVEAETQLLPLEVASDVFPDSPLACLTGPNFAREVAIGLPAAAVVASFDVVLRERVRQMLGTSAFRVYGNDDPFGAQLGGAAKNVIAIAAGAVIGAGLGENARAALVTRGLSEVRRLAVALGGREETVMGLSGLGDLLLTCTGPSSRNFTLGQALGRGESLDSILGGRTNVTEGVRTAGALVARAGSLDLPICRAVADLLAGTQTIDQIIVKLLARPLKDE